MKYLFLRLLNLKANQTFIKYKDFFFDDYYTKYNDIMLFI